jgi:hypothetical protein
MNFLDLLRAGHTDFVLNDTAFDYMRTRALPVMLITRLGVRRETNSCARFWALSDGSVLRNHEEMDLPRRLARPFFQAGMSVDNEAITPPPSCTSYLLSECQEAPCWTWSSPFVTKH